MANGERENNGRPIEAAAAAKFAAMLAARPTNVLIFGDFGGEDFDQLLAERTPRVVTETDELLGALAPVVRVRVEDLSSTDESLLDAKLTFRTLKSFESDALGAAIPALGRWRPRTGGVSDRHGGDASTDGRASQTDLDRAIAAALRGHAAGPEPASPPRGGTGSRIVDERRVEERFEKQLALIRGVERLASVERAWRSLDRILAAARLAPGRCTVSVVPVAPRELRRELMRIDAGEDSEAGDAGLLESLDLCSADPEKRPDLVVFDHVFDVGPGGVAALRAMAEISERCAAIVLTSIDVTEALSGGRGSSLAALASSTGVSRAYGTPMLAGVRTLRGVPSASGLALVLGELTRPAVDSAWRQTGASVLCESLLASQAGGLATLAASRRPLPVPEPTVQAAGGDVVAPPIADAWATCGLIAFAREGNAGGAVEIRPSVPVAYDPPRVAGRDDERSRALSLDVRTRFGLTRLTRLASIAARASGAPGRSSEALRDYAVALSEALADEARALAGPQARVALAASFDGIDERMLRLEVRLALGDSGGAPGAEVLCGCYPLA